MLSLKTIGMQKHLKDFQKRLDPRIRVVLSIHDAVFINCPEQFEQEVFSTIISYMEEPIQGVAGVFETVRVPMAIEMKKGPSWGDMADFDISNRSL